MSVYLIFINSNLSYIVNRRFSTVSPSVIGNLGCLTDPHWQVDFKPNCRHQRQNWRALIRSDSAHLTSAVCDSNDLWRTIGAIFCCQLPACACHTHCCHAGNTCYFCTWTNIFGKNFCSRWTLCLLPVSSKIKLSMSFYFLKIKSCKTWKTFLKSCLPVALVLNPD